MIRVCRKCHRIHNLDYKCEKKVATRNTTELQRKENKFYTSYQWIKLTNEIKKDNLYWCKICRELGEVGVIDEVHHIVPIRKDWSKRLDWNNLIPLCNKHHKHLHNKNIINEEDLIKEIKRLKKNKLISN